MCHTYSITHTIIIIQAHTYMCYTRMIPTLTCRRTHARYHARTHAQYIRTHSRSLACTCACTHKTQALVRSHAYMQACTIHAPMRAHTNGLTYALVRLYDVLMHASTYSLGFSRLYEFIQHIILYCQQNAHVHEHTANAAGAGSSCYCSCSFYKGIGFWGQPPSTQSTLGQLEKLAYKSHVTDQHQLAHHLVNQVVNQHIS